MNVRYVGWEGYGNYGDDVVKDVIKAMGFTFDEISDTTLFGAGTLFPMSEKLKERMTDKDPKNIVVFGAAVNDPKFDTDEYDKRDKETKELLKKAKFVGLRSEYDKKMLGFGEVIGDPLFSIVPPQVEKQGFVILNIGHSAGNCWGGLKAELNCFIAMLDFCKKLKKQIVILPAWIEDVTLAHMAAGYLGTKHLSYPIRLSQMFKLFKAADFAITYKLHPMITALSVNTPVIPIEYRPKIRHVAEDFKIDHLILKTNEVTVEALEEKYELLKKWDYDFVAKMKKERSLKTRNFLKKIKLELGEKQDG